MKKHLILALIALMAGFQIMNAIPARPGRTVYVQPDGTKVLIRQHGDEFGHWATDLSGRLVVQSPDGYFRPAEGITVDEIRRNASARRAAARQNRAARRASGQHIAAGRKHFLVILVEFSNLEFKKNSEDTHAAFNALLNQTGYAANGGTGSARDFYYDNSHGYFEPVFDVYGPVKLDTTYAYYGQNSGGFDIRPEDAVIDGCRKLDGEIDFSQYDNDGDGKVDLVFMYYAGKGEADGGNSNTIWPHQWEISSAGKSLTLDGTSIDAYACTSELNGSGSMCGIGTACHEFAHAMGLPDFYDTDYSDNGQAAGLFFFSLMDSGGYNNDGRTPPFFNIEERIMLGWLDESVIRAFPGAGTYTIPSVDENVAYKTPTDKDGEYFLYECRGSNGWDSELYAHGLVVYHVDKSNRTVRLNYGSTTARNLWENWEAYNSINENGSHPCFYIIPAADQDNLLYGHFLYAGDYYFDYGYSDKIPFPGSKRVTDYTPVSWNKVEGDIAFKDISYSGNVVTLSVTIPYDGLEYNTIADAGSYRAGDRFYFALEEAEDRQPASVAWYFDDEPVSADSVTLTAGAHTIEARLVYADGREEVLTLEIEVQ